MLSSSTIPRFVSAIPRRLSGVDFLGLRQANLDLIYAFLPGFNNVTYYIRPYGLICWGVKAFAELTAARLGETVERKDFRQYVEALETLFNWSHALHEKAEGVLGNTAKQPLDANSDVPLQFAAWKRNVSLLDPVNYGPSLADDSGLKFLHREAPGLWRLTPLGSKLAQAFEQRLESVDAIAKLKTLDLHTANSNFASSLYKAWAQEETSAAEADAFRRAFFSVDAIGETTDLGVRSASLQLMRECLKASEVPLSVTALRRQLASGVGSSGDLLVFAEPLTRQQALFSVIEIRQVQRLALEALFGWCERRLIDDGVRAPAALVDALVVATSNDTFAQERPIGSALKQIEAVANGGRGLYIAGISNSELDVMQHGDDLVGAISETPDKVPMLALRALMLCAVFGRAFADDQLRKQHIARGGFARVSLKHWSEAVYASSDASLAEFWRRVLQNYLLSQHLSTAIMRAEEGKQKLRFSIEQEGLVSLIDPTRPWTPDFARDRLETALSLMSHCGLCQDHDGLYSLRRIG